MSPNDKMIKEIFLNLEKMSMNVAISLCEKFAMKFILQNFGPKSLDIPGYSYAY